VFRSLEQTAGFISQSFATGHISLWFISACAEEFCLQALRNVEDIPNNVGYNHLQPMTDVFSEVQKPI